MSTKARKSAKQAPEHLCGRPTQAGWPCTHPVTRAGEACYDHRHMAAQIPDAQAPLASADVAPEMPLGEPEATDAVVQMPDLDEGQQLQATQAAEQMRIGPSVRYDALDKTTLDELRQGATTAVMTPGPDHLIDLEASMQEAGYTLPPSPLDQTNTDLDPHWYADRPAWEVALALCVAANVPVCLWGPPGIGKTQTLYTMMNDLGLPEQPVGGSYKLAASAIDPVAIGGLPMSPPEALIGGASWEELTNKGVPYLVMPPAWAAIAVERSGIIFIDEISTAAPAVQHALLHVVDERRVGALVLGNRVRIVLAGNPPSDTTWETDTNPLTHTMLSRMCNIEVPPPSHTEVDRGIATLFSRWHAESTSTSDEWHAARRNMWPTVSSADIARELDGRPAGMMVRAFFTSDPTGTALLDQSLHGRMQRKEEGGILLPRTIALTGRILAVGIKTRTPLDHLSPAINGLLGEEVGQKFVQWAKQQAMVDPVDVLEGRKILARNNPSKSRAASANVEFVNPDQMIVLTMSIAATYVNMIKATKDARQRAALSSKLNQVLIHCAENELAPQGAAIIRSLRNTDSSVAETWVNCLVANADERDRINKDYSDEMQAWRR
jgi:energy-coupling factor transporter ATP-binding protein EcfA2